MFLGPFLSFLESLKYILVVKSPNFYVEFLVILYDLLINYKLLVDRSTYLNNYIWKYMRTYNLQIYMYIF